MVPLCAKSLFITGLTATLLLCCAGSAAAGRGSLKETMRRAHRAATTSRAAKNRRVRPPVGGRALRATRKRVVRLPRIDRAITSRVARALSAPLGVVTRSMLRPSGSAPDLNPMPQLLDYDDRTRDMRTSAGKLRRMIEKH